LWAREAGAFIKTIMPFVRVKRKQCELGMMYQNMLTHANTKIGDDEMMRRLAMRDEMVRLNGRVRLDSLWTGRP
jgi:hypothetical protein